MSAHQLSLNIAATSVVVVNEVRLRSFCLRRRRRRRRHLVNSRLHFRRRRCLRFRRSSVSSRAIGASAGGGVGVVQPGGTTATLPAGRSGDGVGGRSTQRWKNSTRCGGWNSGSALSPSSSCGRCTDLTLNVRTLPCRSTPRYQRRRRRRRLGDLPDGVPGR